MPDRRTLTPEEEARCLSFLKHLSIDSPDHRILSDRGYFGLFLTGLRPEHVPEDDHPSLKEFKETIRLLSILGAEGIRGLLARPRSDPPTQTPSDPGTPRPSTHQAARNAAAAAAEPLHRQRVLAAISQVRTGSSSRIETRRPSSGEVTRYRELLHSDSSSEVLIASERLFAAGDLADAYHVIVDYLLAHPLNGELLEQAAAIIRHAGQFDRARGIAPTNMLYECEEMAAVIARKVPDMARLAEAADEPTRILYGCVKLVYRAWVDHCHQLLLYRYTTATGEFVQRHWIDPRDFGFLCDAMRMGVRSRLPLDLVRFIYVELKRCVAVGVEAIAHQEKRCRFIGDTLRMLASPVKDVIPDMQLEIYREILAAYVEEGDSQNALIFCRQALLLKNNDPELLRLKGEMESRGQVQRRR